MPSNKAKAADGRVRGLDRNHTMLLTLEPRQRAALAHASAKTGIPVVEIVRRAIDKQIDKET